MRMRSLSMLFGLACITLFMCNSSLAVEGLPFVTASEVAGLIGTEASRLQTLPLSAEITILRKREVAGVPFSPHERLATVSYFQDGERYHAKSVVKALIENQWTDVSDTSGLWDGKAYWYLKKRLSRHKTISPIDGSEILEPSHVMYVHGRWEGARASFFQEFSASEMNGVPHSRSMPFDNLFTNSSDYRLLDEELVDGHLCYHLEVKNTEGKYDLWVDPEIDFNFRKATIVRNYDSSEIERASENVKNLSPLIKGLIHQNSVDAPRRTVKTFQLDDLVFEEIDGSPFPISFRTRMIFEYDNGGKVEDEILVSRQEIVAYPDFDALDAFRMDAPVGTPVTVEEAPGVAYTWDGNGRLSTSLD